MSVVNFPNNRKYYIEQADRYLKENEYRLELEYLIKAYEIEKDFNLNHRIAKSYFDFEESEKALAMIQEFEKHYLKSHDSQKFYFKILIDCEHFENAYHLLNKELADHPEFENLLNELDLSLEKTIKAKGLEPEQLLRDLYSIGSLEEENQLYVCSMASLIPLDELEQASQSVFSNPYVSHLIKTALINSLINAGSVNTFDYPLANQKYKVDLKKLTDFENDQLQIQITKNLDEILDYSPVDKTMIHDEVTYHLSILYPLHNEIIVDITEWINYYVDYFLNEKTPKVEHKEMYQWFRLLTSEELK